MTGNANGVPTINNSILFLLHVICSFLKSCDIRSLTISRQLFQDQWMMIF